MNIGDYVRTKDGIIWKPNKIEEIEGKWFFDDYYWYNKDYIKSSPNIIDLIEEGDLVKIEYYSLRYEERVTRLFEVYYKDNKFMNLGNTKCEFMLVDGDFNDNDKQLKPIIKSIVTKEQFDSMEYRIG